MTYSDLLTKRVSEDASVQRALSPYSDISQASPRSSDGCAENPPAKRSRCDGAGEGEGSLANCPLLAEMLNSALPVESGACQSPQSIAAQLCAAGSQLAQTDSDNGVRVDVREGSMSSEESDTLNHLSGTIAEQLATVQQITSSALPQHEVSGTSNVQSIALSNAVTAISSSPQLTVTQIGQRSSVHYVHLDGSLSVVNTCQSLADLGSPSSSASTNHVFGSTASFVPSDFQKESVPRCSCTQMTLQDAGIDGIYSVSITPDVLGTLKPRSQAGDGRHNVMEAATSPQSIAQFELTPRSRQGSTSTPMRLHIRRVLSFPQNTGDEERPHNDSITNTSTMASTVESHDESAAVIASSSSATISTSPDDDTDTDNEDRLIIDMTAADTDEEPTSNVCLPTNLISNTYNTNSETGGVTDKEMNVDADRLQGDQHAESSSTADTPTTSTELVIREEAFKLRTVSCLLRGSQKLALIESINCLYFPDYDVEEFHASVRETLGIRTYRLTMAEEQAFIKFFNLPVERLLCNRAIAMDDFQRHYSSFAKLFKK